MFEIDGYSRIYSLEDLHPEWLKWTTFWHLKKEIWGNSALQNGFSVQSEKERRRFNLSHHPRFCPACVNCSERGPVSETGRLPYLNDHICCYPVVSDSLHLHGLQHVILPCPSPSPGACSNSCPLNRWRHPTISSSIIPFSSCLQFFPASESFLVSQLCASGGQSIGASASASALPVNVEDWFPLGWTGWISLQFRGTLKYLL